MKRLVTAAAVLLAAAHPLAAQDRWPAFAPAIDAFMAADSVVGGSAVLVRDGRIVARHDRGFADRAAGERAAEGTIYHWASITKTLTAVAIMQLRDRGRLSLDDRITTWVPELRQVHIARGSMDDITIRMLLSHSSGFQNGTWPYGRGRDWEPFEPTRWEQLVAMMPYQEVLFPPGSRFGYSNPAFIYLARVIESVTGDPYQSYIQKNIWTPLGMTRSYFGATPYHLAASRSNNYTLRRDSGGVRVVANGRDFDPGITIPNGGWNAPLADLATWVGFLSGAPVRDTALARRQETVLSRKSIVEMWQPVIALAEGDDLGAAVGLSFFLFPSGADTLVGHTGEQAGFRSFFYLNPRTRTAVIAGFNTVNDAVPASSRNAWSTVTRRAIALVQ